MPNLAVVLRQEIRRLARQEARAEIATVKRSSGQYRRDIAGLKRELAVALRKIAVLESELRRGRGAAEPAVEDAETKRWSPRGLKTHRKRLGLSAKQYGALIGVSGQTIYHWESGQQRPRARQFAATLAVRGLGKRAALARLGTSSSRTNNRPRRARGRRSSRKTAITKPALAQLLRSHDGNVSAVARELGKARNQIHRWCGQHGLRAADYR